MTQSAAIEDTQAAAVRRNQEARQLARTLLDWRKQIAHDVFNLDEHPEPIDQWADTLQAVAPDWWKTFTEPRGLPRPTDAVKVLAIAMVRTGDTCLNPPLIPDADQRPVCVRDSWLQGLDTDQLARLEAHQDDTWVPAATIAGTIEPWACWEIREVQA